MAHIVRNVGTVKHSRNVDGEEITRQDRVFLPSANQWYACMPYDNQFIYRSRRKGSSVLCTCGSIAVTVGYHVYKQWVSYMGNEILVCQYHMNSGKHADGSS